MQYWRGDYSCECAYNAGRYTDAVVTSHCAHGGAELFKEKQETVSNYDVSYFLDTSPDAFLVRQVMV